jgi:colanic acid/amylovoran biosynthesis glycosyltransferase
VTATSIDSPPVPGRAPGPAPRLAYVIGTYPSLTTTFIDREIELLRRWGVAVHVVSLRRPHQAVSEDQRRLRRGVRYVLPVRPLALLTSHAWWLGTRPWAYLAALVHVVGGPHPSPRRRGRSLLHFAMAVHVARLVQRGPEVDHVHAHFVDRATTVAMVVSRLLGLPYSATAHANDIYVDPVLLPEKLRGASFVATCTGYNASHLASIAGAGAKVVCVHHGLDLDRYEPARAVRAAVPTVLTVAQLKPKKGLADLIDACAELRRRGHDFRCLIVGEGPLRAELEGRIRRRGLGDVVRLLGALDHSAVVEHYRRAELFVLPCVTAPDGDRDGIPNVLLEAMAMELPVVSTRHSGIPEAVEDGRSGFLVEPHDPAGLADAIARLLHDPETGRHLGRRGRAIVLESFDLDANVRELLRCFTMVEVPRG